MKYEIDQDVQRDLQNYLIPNGYATHLTHYHISTLEMLSPEQQRTCVDWTIKKKYKTIFKTGWINNMPKSDDRSVDGLHYRVGNITCTTPDLQPFLDEAVSEWHDVWEQSGNAAANAFAKRKRVELEAIEKQLLNQ